MKSPEEFEQYYQSTALPLLQNLESERRSVVTSFSAAMLSLVLFVPVILLFIFFENPWLLVLLIGPVVFTGFQFNSYSKKKKTYVQHFKAGVIAGMVKAVDEQLNYFPESLISVAEYHESDIFRTQIDSYTGGDLVEGKSGVTSLKFSELHHQQKREVTDSKGNRHTEWVTIFKGIFFIADFNKNFNGRTYVFPDSGFDFLGIGKMLERWIAGRGEPVTLEDPVFEKYFKVLSDDQVEARYILSTSFMERLVGFREKVKAKIYLSFIHSKVFIAIPLQKDLFEPNVFSSGVNSGYLKEYFFYLNLVTGIVDDLNLNTRIWSKQQ